MFSVHFLIMKSSMMTLTFCYRASLRKCLQKFAAEILESTALLTGRFRHRQV